MHRFGVPALVVLLLWTCGCEGAKRPQDIVIGPYVNHVDQTSAKVLWVAPGGMACGGGLLTGAEAADGAEPATRIRSTPIEDRTERLYTMEVSGLQSGRTYRYVVACGSDRAEGVFHTAPSPDSKDPFRFVVYGDTRSRPDCHRSVIRAMKTELPLAFFINTGDLIESGRVWEHWARDFFDPAWDLLTQTTIWPVRGNHEDDAVLYRQLFDLPHNELYYSFDYGNLHVVVLDNYQYDVDESMSVNQAAPEMLAWLKKDLSAARAAGTAEWIIVSYHEPTFNVGGHGSRWGREDVLPILEKFGVDLVLNGHSHLYERFRPIGPEGGKPIVHVVTGGGGAPTYPARPSPIIEASYSDLHYCLFTIQGNRLEMAAKTPAGKVIDRLTLVKTDGAFQKEIMARALPTDQAIDLAFIASVRLRADFVTLPAPGTPGPVDLVAIDPLPAGATLHIASPHKGRWKVTPAEFPIPRRTDPEAAPEPFRIMAQPPDDVRVGPHGIIPPLSVRLSVTYEGKTYSAGDRMTSLSHATLVKLTPQPAAADVPHAPKAITVDGRLDDWAAVPPLVVPATGSPSRITRLAWRAEGLYAAMSVPDSHVEAVPGRAWAGDSVEVFVEADAARSADARKNPNALKAVVYPLPESGPGKAGVAISYGRFVDSPEVIEAAWRRTDDGYTLEFLIPARALAPATMAPGTRIGFNTILRDGTKVIEQFADTEGKRSVWRAPIHWGAVRLAE